MNIYIATSNDPFYNLAIEHWLFQEILTDNIILYLWQNKPCVVIGRAQNPWRECDIQSLSDNNIPIIRRQSGGGAVYHDLGNLNYTIMAPKELYDKRNNFKAILKVLGSIGVQAGISSKNDFITYFKGIYYKISGNAFRQTKDRCLQHGTMLINTDINRLYEYLHHNIDANIETTGVQSVRSKVINLSGIYPGLCVHKVLQAFLNQYHSCITYLPSNLTHSLIIQEIQKFKTWKWCFAKTLPFCKKLSFGKQSFRFNIHQGQIVKMYTKSGFENLEYWIISRQPNYDKCSFMMVPKNFTMLEQQIMQVLLDTIPSIPKNK